MNYKAFFSFLVLAASAMATSAAQAGVVTSLTFNEPLVLSDTQAPGTWYTDRRAPNATEIENLGGNNVLAMQMRGADVVADPFYNTVGRKYNLGPGATKVEFDFFVGDGWTTSGRRMAGGWGTAFQDLPDPAIDPISFYPIIEYAMGSWSYWNGASLVSTGLSTSNNTWYNLGFELDTTADLFRYYVNDVLVGTVGAGGSDYIGNFIFQGYLAGMGRDDQFVARIDNLVATAPDSNPVPEPGSLALAGLACLAAAGATRRMKPKHS